MLSRKKISILSVTVTTLALLAVSCGGTPAGETASLSETTPTSASRLLVVFKDPGMPDVRYLQPTIKEVQLQHESGS